MGVFDMLKGKYWIKQQKTNNTTQCWTKSYFGIMNNLYSRQKFCCGLASDKFFSFCHVHSVYPVFRTILQSNRVQLKLSCLVSYFF